MLGKEGSVAPGARGAGPTSCTLVATAGLPARRLGTLCGRMWHDNLIQLFRAQVDENPTRPLLRFYRYGEWHSWSGAEVARRVAAIAGGLDVLGVRPGDRVGIITEARAEWLLSDLGAISAGGVIVALHARLPADELAIALDHSEARVAFVEDRRAAARLASVRHRIPQLEQVIMLDGEAPDDLGILSLAALESLAAPGRGEARAAAGAALRADAPFAIGYRIDERGRVRGSCLTHRNIMGTLRALRSAYGATLEPVTTTLSVSPPASLRERVLGAYLSLYLGHSIVLGRGPEWIVEDLGEVRPGYLVAAPRVLEALHGQLCVNVDTSPPLRRLVLEHALALGRAHGRLVRGRRAIPAGLARRWAIADRLALSRLRARLGGRLALIACGGSSLSAEVTRFFDALGVVISEGWGRSETTAAATVNPPSAVRIGSAGRPLPGVEVKVAEDGELRVRGVNVFAGYHRDPEATAAVLDSEGFVRTGDTGRIDAQGFVHVTGRDEERITTSGGQRIVPGRLESLLRERPLIADALVFGDRRPYVVALLTLDRKALAIAHPTLADRRVQDAGVRRLLESELRRVNLRLPAAARVRDFRILPREVLLETGELGCALRPRRRVIEESHRIVLESMYVREAAISRSV